MRDDYRSSFICVMDYNPERQRQKDRYDNGTRVVELLSAIVRKGTFCIRGLLEVHFCAN